MRKRTLFTPPPKILILLTGVVLFNSCQKEMATEPPKISSDVIIEKVNAWLEAKKSITTGNFYAKVESVQNSLEFSAMWFEEYKQKDRFVIVPLKNSFISESNQDKNPGNFLVVVLTTQGDITKGNLVQYINPTGDSKSIPENTISKIFNYQNLNCNGKFTMLSVYDRFLYELTFENTKLKSVAERKSRAETTSNRSTDICIDWYLVTTYYYDDGTTYTDEQFIGRTCYGPEEVQQPQGGSGGGPVEYEYEVAKTVIWHVYNTLGGTPQPSGFGFGVHSTENIRGKRNVSNPNGGIFKSASHHISTCNSCSDPQNPSATYSETSSTVSHTDDIVSSTVSGTYSHNGTWRSITGSRSWSFSQIF